MSEELSEPATALPRVQPVLADGIPPADSALEIPTHILGGVREITVSRQEVSRLAAKDKCTQRLLKELAEVTAEALPSRARIEAQKKIAAMAYQELSRLRSLRQKKIATITMIQAQLRQRLATIQEREEGRKVLAIRGRLSPRYRGDVVPFQG